VLRSVVSIFVIGADLVARNQSYARNQIIRVHDQKIAQWIECITTPIHTAEVAGDV
jgi:hypothetical protein